MSRVAVVGAGAIGATAAAAVQETGRHDLAVCVRTPLERLVVERDGAQVEIAAPILTGPAQARGPVDWVLLAVKAHQTAGAAGWLEALCGPATTVVVLQNGIEHRERVAPLAGPATVLPCVVWIPAEVVAPGHVRQRNPAPLSVPDEPAGHAFAELLKGSHGASVEVRADFDQVAWRKLCLNAITGLMALTDRRGVIFQRADIRRVSFGLALECAAVARAHGVDLPEPDRFAEEIVAYVAGLPADMGGSILADRRAGRRLEWDARNGVIQRLGARHGVPTPVSDVVVPLLAALSDAPADGELTASGQPVGSRTP